MKALISVSDKTGVVELSKELQQLGFEIISTGGTAKALSQAKIPCTEVSEFTGSPEMMEGRLKTLHPKIFGGILYLRNNPKHKSDADSHDIPAIDWVIVNLYPFEKIQLENKLPPKEMIEFIDVGGPSMLRAAGKNFQDVVVLCDPKDYARVLAEQKENGSISLSTKKELAAKVFAHTAHYDSMIAKFFSRADELAPNSLKKKEFSFPEELTVGLRKVSDLRYGENPHQKAALYQESGDRQWGVVSAEKLQGKELSFNNYIDLDAAWQIVSSFTGGSNGTACVIIKHTNPCGTAVAPTTLEAFQSAFAADPQSAFGGIVGFSTAVDEDTANELSKTFFECIIAPDYSLKALEAFKKKSNLRILRQKISLSIPYELDLKKISGGVLVQDQDFEPVSATPENRRVVTKRAPTPEETYSLEFAWKVCKQVKSNAIVLSRGTVTQAVGAGQMSRIDALRIALQKAGLALTVPNISSKKGSGPSAALVMASDAFFPFRDCVDEAAKAGISAIIQPGGSIRDPESIDAANEHGISMIFTGIRHFKH